MGARFQNYIGGKWCDAKDDRRFSSQNPFTGEEWATAPRSGAPEAASAVDAAHAAFADGPWSALGAAERARLLNKFADALEENADKLAEIETRDNGKLFAETRAQCRYLPSWFRYYAGMADTLEGRAIPADKPGHIIFTRKEPLGVVVCITPWNSPLFLLAWKLAPLLAAGNTCVVKPSEHAAMSTLELAKLFDAVGFPPGVFNVIAGYGDEVGPALMGHPRVAKIAFTGGEQGGRAAYEAAAQGFKSLTLELGGKSPNIVFDDCNIDGAVNGVVAGIFAAAGQTCVAGSRLLMQRSIADQFVDRLVDSVRSIKFGDPMDLDTQIGPIATRGQFEKILKYIDIAKSEGADVVFGGEALSGEGLGQGQFVAPTIVTNVKPQMRIAQEEVFGPILSAIPFEGEDDAIAIANGVPFGLAAGVWTRDVGRAVRMSERLAVGTVWINTYRAVSYKAPFGGYKHSGVGRENGAEAIEEYLQTKTVWISMTESTAAPFVMR